MISGASEEELNIACIRADIMVALEEKYGNYDLLDKLDKFYENENKDLKKQLYSPDQVETICPKCGEKLYINYSREVYDLKQENHMLKQAVDNTYETSQDIMYEMQQENEHYKNILTEFEKWLEKLNGNGEVLLPRECLDKLQELKEGKK